MEKGQIIEFKITDMSSEANGIGRYDGMVVFVPGAIVGDTVKARVKILKKNFANAELLEIMEESEFRNEEFDCPFFDEGCGGCAYGKISYEKQLEIKYNQVKSKLERLAGLDSPKVSPIIGMTAEDNDGNGEYRYRNKVEFAVEDGRVGFRRFKSRDCLDCCDCYLQTPSAMACAEVLRNAELNRMIEQMTVKTAFATGEVMVVLKAKTSKLINADADGKYVHDIEGFIDNLDEAVYEAGYSLESVVAKIPRGRNDKGVMKYENAVLAGSPVIRDEIDGLEFEISADSFYQVNTVQMKRLYDKVREYVQGNVLDLYCGVGSIGLYCAGKAAKVVGVETVREAVLDANRNAVINGIVNATYVCGKSEDEIQKVIGSFGDEGVDTVILDPPRAGCRPELLDALIEADVPRIVYVSCDPATLARDVKLLTAGGFEFAEATPVDMFPHTGHVECVVLLSK